MHTPRIACTAHAGLCTWLAAGRHCLRESSLASLGTRNGGNGVGVWHGSFEESSPIVLWRFDEALAPPEPTGEVTPQSELERVLPPRALPS